MRSGAGLYRERPAEGLSLVTGRPAVPILSFTMLFTARRAPHKEGGTTPSRAGRLALDGVTLRTRLTKSQAIACRSREGGARRRGARTGWQAKEAIASPPSHLPTRGSGSIRLRIRWAGPPGGSGNGSHLAHVPKAQRGSSHATGSPRKAPPVGVPPPPGDADSRARAAVHRASRGRDARPPPGSGRPSEMLVGAAPRV
jgi:hypothetical protein